MRKIRSRASRQLPSVLLTLLSIIQAIALDGLWNRTVARSEFFELSSTAVLGWLQTVVTLSTIILIWAVHVRLVMRFRWTPSLYDVILPFVVGIAEFALIAVTDPGLLGQWCLALALAIIVGMAIDLRFLRRARRDPRNSEFFDEVSPSTWRDYLAHIFTVLFLISAAVFILATGYIGWFSFVPPLIVFAAIACTLHMEVHFWSRSMGDSPN